MDRGDDLLEATRFAPKIQKKSEAPHELFENARILHGEGLVHEAKRTLHLVLMRDPEHRAAQDLLDKIRDDELKELLGDSAPRLRPRLQLDHLELNLGGIDTQALLEKLDSDLGLGLTQGLRGMDLLSGLSDDHSARAFQKQLDAAQRGAALQDYIDLGVGFFEMECFDLALAQWERAARQPELMTSVSRRTELASLRALALIFLGRAFDAQTLLEEALAEPEIDPSFKTEIFYLMGRVLEKQGKVERAHHWYRAVFDLDPLYRDAAERLRKSP